MKSTSPALTVEEQLREMNEALLVSSVHQHELTEQADQARDDANKSRDAANKSRDAANKSRDAANKSRDDANKSRDDANKSRDDANRSRDEANTAHDGAVKLTAALRESEHRYRTLFDAMDEGYCIIEVLFDVQQQPVDYRFIEVNGSFERQAGMHDVVGKRMLEFVSAIEPHWLRNYGTVALTGEGIRFSGEYKGLHRYFDVYAFRAAGWSEHHIAVLFADVTQRKRAEEAVARLASIVTSSDDAIISKDLDGVITTWNRGAERVFGYTAEEAIGKPVTLLIPEDHLDEEPRILARIRRGESIEHYETVRRRKDGRLLDISLTVSPIKDSAGQVTGASKVARDITERKQAEQALRESEQRFRYAADEAEEANRAKDMFLATLSHEMRTPLSAIIGWMQILQGGAESGFSDAELNEGLEAIERNSRAMAQLLDDVMDVSRIVSGKVRLEVRPCELSEVIRAGIDVVRSAARAKDIALTAELDPGASAMSCDAARMQQVVWNLVANAVKFTPREGKVHVTLAREGSDVRIAVSDSGQGIGPDLLPYVFDRFRQADSSTRRRFGGLGLGLSIVKHLVELHGGTVQVQSEGEGRGSTFTVLLPIRAVRTDESGDDPDEEESELSSTRGMPLVRLDGLRVLVVDDEPDARRLLVRVLQQAGAVVTAAASAAEAIEALEKSNPEVLVSDLGMPDEDGYDLIRQIRALGHHAKDLPAVALTAFVHKNDRRQALLSGFQFHVPKPADPHDLTAVIASLAGRTGN